ncbi:Replication protein A 70 kDa DNA-binding subunit D, partial [Bienertia sinuspersici]
IGETTISNSLFATKILVDEAIPEVHEFKKSICNEADGDSQRLTHLSSQGPHSIYNEFLTLSEKMQLDEIFDTAKECFCATYATIVGIDNNMWYYDSCKQCNKKVEYEGGGKYWCTKCDLHFKSAPKRYKVTVTVQDDSGSATFVMFDREIFQVLQISAMNLKEMWDKENKEDAYPEELNKLLDKKFLFRIHISKYNLEQNWNKYTVVRLTEDENVIKSFLEVDSLEEKDVEVESTKQKDSISVIADNEDSSICSITPTKRSFKDSTNDGKVGETSPAQLSTSKKGQ